MLGLGLTKFIPFVVYIICIVVIILNFVKSPKYGLYLIAFLVPLQNLLEKLYQFPFGKNINDILLIATLICLLLYNKKDKTHAYSDKITRPVIFLGLITYFSLWVGYIKFGVPMPISYESEYLVQWKNFMMLPVIYFITVHTIENKKQIISLIWIIAVATLLTALYFYNDAIGTDFSHYRQSMRYSIASTFTYLGPNELASFFVLMSLFFISFIILDTNKTRRIFFFIVCCFSIYGIIFLFSRGAYLSFLVGIIMLGVLKSRKLLLLLIVIFISWHTIVPKAVIERVKMTESEEGLDHSSASRIKMWEKAIEAIKTNPISGIGFGGTKLLGIKNDTTGKGVRRNVHNGYLAILIEQGIIGLIIWLYIFYFAARNGLYLFRYSKDNYLKGLGLGLFIMVVSTLVDNLTGFNWLYFNVMGYFWIIFGLVTKAKQIDVLSNQTQE